MFSAAAASSSSAASRANSQHEWPPLAGRAVHETSGGRPLTLDDLESYLGFNASIQKLEELFNPDSQATYFQQTEIISQIVTRYLTNVGEEYLNNYFILLKTAIVKLGSENSFGIQLLKYVDESNGVKETHLKNCINSALNLLHQRASAYTPPCASLGDADESSVFLCGLSSLPPSSVQSGDVELQTFRSDYSNAARSHSPLFGSLFSQAGPSSVGPVVHIQMDAPGYPFVRPHQLPCTYVGPQVPVGSTVIGKIYNKNEQLVFEGNFTRTGNAPALISRQGPGTEHWLNDDLMITGNFADDRYDGECTTLYKNTGNKFYGPYEKGVHKGIFTLINREGVKVTYDYPGNGRDRIKMALTDAHGTTLIGFDPQGYTTDKTETIKHPDDLSLHEDMAFLLGYDGNLVQLQGLVSGNNLIAKNEVLNQFAEHFNTKVTVSQLNNHLLMMTMLLKSLGETSSFASGYLDLLNQRQFRLLGLANELKKTLTTHIREQKIALMASLLEHTSMPDVLANMVSDMTIQ